MDSEAITCLMITDIGLESLIIKTKDIWVASPEYIDFRPASLRDGKNCAYNFAAKFFDTIPQSIPLLMNIDLLYPELGETWFYQGVFQYLMTHEKPRTITYRSFKTILIENNMKLPDSCTWSDIQIKRLSLGRKLRVRKGPNWSEYLQTIVQLYYNKPVFLSEQPKLPYSHRQAAFLKYNQSLMNKILRSERIQQRNHPQLKKERQLLKHYRKEEEFLRNRPMGL